MRPNGPRWPELVGGGSLALRWYVDTTSDVSRAMANPLIWYSDVNVIEEEAWYVLALGLGGILTALRGAPWVLGFSDLGD